MKRLLALPIVLAFAAVAARAQVTPNSSVVSPTEVVDELWRMATQGDLLTPEGWRMASGFFIHPEPFPGNNVILVMSNYWGPPGQLRTEGDAAEVLVGFANAGQIDSALRYTPPKVTAALKTGMSYRLVFGPSHGKMSVIGPDGKVKEEKEVTGPSEWRIDGSQGSPWTTVNTAIRYVLEMRDKSTDPVIERNADDTLAKLLKLH